MPPMLPDAQAYLKRLPPPSSSEILAVALALEALVERGLPWGTQHACEEAANELRGTAGDAPGRRLSPPRRALIIVRGVAGRPAAVIAVVPAWDADREVAVPLGEIPEGLRASVRMGLPMTALADLWATEPGGLRLHAFESAPQGP